MRPPIDPSDPRYPTPDVVDAANKVRVWMDERGARSLCGLHSQSYVSELQGHLLKIMDGSWTYVHGWCTLQSVFKVWDDARKFLS